MFVVRTGAGEVIQVEQTVEEEAELEELFLDWLNGLPSEDETFSVTVLPVDP